MTSIKLRIGFIAAWVLVSVGLVAEHLVWDGITDATSYRVQYGPVGGPTNTLMASTNSQTWTNPISGATFQKPGVANLALTLNQRYFFTVQTVISNSGSVFIADPATVLFFTPRGSPTNQQVIGGQ